MASSYLKFDGKPGQSALGQMNLWSATGSVVLTAYLRILQIPTYTAPIIGIAESGSNAVGIGIWLNRDLTNHTGHFASNAIHESGGAIERALTLVDATTGGAPVRIGRIYKVQAIVAWDGAGGGFRMSFAVDGVIIKRADFAGGTGLAVLTNPVLRIAGSKLNNLDLLSGQDIREAHVEIIQAMVELDRTIAFDGSGNITTVDADAGPWADLSVSGTGSSEHLYLLNEGTGNPQDSVGNADIIGTNLDWASTAGDPVVTSSTATYSFDHIESYSLRQTDSPVVIPLPQPGPEGPVGDKTSGELRLAPRSTWRWSDGEQLSELGGTQLTVDSTRKWEGNSSLHADGAAATNNYGALTLLGGAADEFFWGRAQFYDPGGTTSNRIQRFSLLGVGNNAMVGVIQPATGTYEVNIGGSGNVDTGVSISVGWHEFLLYVEIPSIGSGDCRAYIDGVEVHEVLATTSARFNQYGFRQRGVSATNDDGYWDGIDIFYYKDSISAGDFNGAVEPSGTLVLGTLTFPNPILSLDSVTITDESAGSNSFEIGSLSYTFRHSLDGGSTWGASTTLNTANLQALDCESAGNDALEISIAFTSGLDNISTPAVRSIAIGYTAGWTEQSADTSSWTELQNSSSDTSAELSGVSATWTEKSNSSSDTNIELQPSSTTWVESS